MQTSKDLSGNVLTIQIPPSPKKEKPCLRCGRTGHLSITCKVKKDKDGKDIESDDGYFSDGHP